MNTLSKPNYQYVLNLFFIFRKKFFFSRFLSLKQYVFKGLTKDQVNVDVRDNNLIISGATNKDERYQEGNTHIQERRYGSFSRSISLPPNVKPDDITAKFENGLLELKLPKTVQTGKKITIQ